MQSHKFVEFNPEGAGVYVKFLEYLAKKKSWPWSFETHPDYDPELLTGAAAAFVNPVLSGKILSQLPTLTSQVRSSETLDTFFCENHRWYPRLLLHEALRLVLIGEARDLDVRAPAFVVGTDERARTAASALSEIGFSNIYLVGDVETLQQQKIVLSRSQLGVQFKILAQEDLTLQAVSAGIVVNTVDLTKDNDLFTDLSYFNYMKAAGYVLDLNIYPIHNILLEEAEKADLKAISPRRVAEVFTQLWFDWMKMKEDLAAEEIHESWKSFLQENPPSV